MGIEQVRAGRKDENQVEELVELEKELRQLQRRATGRLQRRLRKWDKAGALRARAQATSYGYAAKLVSRRIRELSGEDS